MEALREFLWALKRNRKYQIIAGSIIVGIIIIGIIIFFIVKSNAEESSIVFNSEANINGSVNSKETLPRFIDGIKVNREVANIHPVGVMIENMSTVRPQKGLSKANLAYEALAEGGITRFLAIFASDDIPKEIGPVRSARPYYVEWADELKSVYIHCGGSPEALSLIPKTKVIDVNQIGGDQRFFIRRKNLPAPHNLFITQDLFVRLIRDKKVPLVGNFEPWLFKTEIELANRPEESKSIIIDFSTFSYKVEYKYDRAANDYLRFNGGQPHKDGLTDEQIRVKNIIIEKVQTGLLDQKEGRLKMSTAGEGDALIFQDGIGVEGKWKKDTERTRFYDANGKEIMFNPGSTWIEVVPQDRSIIY